MCFFIPHVKQISLYILHPFPNKVACKLFACRIAFNMHSKLDAAK